MIGVIGALILLFPCVFSDGAHGPRSGVPATCGQAHERNKGKQYCYGSYRVVDMLVGCDGGSAVVVVVVGRITIIVSSTAAI